jgi:hypothetical protein
MILEAHYLQQEIQSLLEVLVVHQDLGIDLLLLLGELLFIEMVLE